MTLYIVLLVVLLAIWVTSFMASGYELMSPVPLALLGLCVSVTLSIVGLFTWNHVELRWEGFSVVATGSVSLLAGSALANRLVGKKMTHLPHADETSGYVASVWKYYLVMVILVLAIGVRVTETYRIGAEIGADLSSYPAVAKAVRNELAGFMSSEGIRAGVGFSFLERQLEKVATVSGYVSAYLIATHLTARKRRETILSVAMMALACCFCLVTGSRGTALYYAIAFAVCLYICRVRLGWPKRESVRFFLAGIVVACVAVPLFVLSGAVVGRSVSSGLVEYASFYYGCGTPALQQVLNTGDLQQLAPGVRSFYYLFSVPYKIGLISDYPSYSIAWVDMGGYGCNIFTGFARYYLDFGIMGVVALSVLAALFMTVLYRFARSMGLPVLVVLAGYLGAYAFDFAREEFIFSKLLSPTQFVSVSLMLLITLFLTTSLRGDMRWLRAKLAMRRGEESN